MDSSKRESISAPLDEKSTVPIHQRIKVFKSDGSLQCGQGTPVSLEKMAAEFKGIKIYSQQKLNDGMMRMQVCGAPTGESNVYEISKTDLEAALKKGFAQWVQ